MQVVDITAEYSEEEKRIISEELECRRRKDEKESELFFLEREWNSHVMGNHTDVFSPIGFSFLALVAWGV